MSSMVLCLRYAKSGTEEAYVCTRERGGVQCRQRLQYQLPHCRRYYTLYCSTTHAVPQCYTLRATYLLPQCIEATHVVHVPHSVLQCCILSTGTTYSVPQDYT
eukprot:1256293-Rhodomonas_salina.1